MSDAESSAPKPQTPFDPASVDPATVLPIEAARAHIRHWWREPLAGGVAFAAGLYDAWYYGHDAGLSSALDEILVVGGIVLIAGSRRLFAAEPSGNTNGASKR